MPAEHRRLVALLEACHVSVTGRHVDLTDVPLDTPFLELDRYGVTLDSVDVLELVVALEDALGHELDVAIGEDDWARYRWGDFLADLGRATGAGLG